MSLMFARRAQAKKQIEANKAKAHAENHKRAHAAFGKPEKLQEQKPAEPEAKAQDGSLKPGTK